MTHHEWVAKLKGKWLDARCEDIILSVEQLLLLVEDCFVATNAEFRIILEAAHKMWQTEVTQIPGNSAKLGGREPGLPFKLPDEIAGCSIKQQLGSGGMGVVYEAWDPKLKLAVAVKMLRHGVFNTPTQRERHMREARTIAKLNHPNIVRIYKVEETNDKPALPCLVLELIHGTSLERFRVGTKWNANDAARLVEILAWAIEYAHKSHVIHRDLKPSNILLHIADSEDDQTAPSLILNGSIRVIPKIADFGLAKRLDESDQITRTGDIIGTLQFAPPELISGHAQSADARADVYGLGAILYCLLTSKPPYIGTTPAEVIEIVTNPDKEPRRPRALVPGIPLGLEAICLKCLAKPPEGRYATAADLANDLQAFLNGDPTVATPEGPFNRLTGVFRQSPRSARFQSWRPLIFSVAILGLVSNTLLYAMRYYHVPNWCFACHAGIVILTCVTLYCIAWNTTQPADTGRELLLIFGSAVISCVFVTVYLNAFVTGNWIDDNLGWPVGCICSAQAAIPFAHRLKKYFYLIPFLFWLLALFTALDPVRAPLTFGIGWFFIILFAGLSVPGKKSLGRQYG